MFRPALFAILIAYVAISLIGAARSLVSNAAADSTTATTPQPTMPPRRAPAEPVPAQAPAPPLPPRPATPPAMPGGPPPPAPAPVDSFVAERDSLMNDLLKKIAGRENAPAESVFKDIRVFKGMPAGRLMRVMNFGLGKSLGVSCKHCHVAGDWAKEDKPQKQIARDMSGMVNTINTELLPKIKNLKSDRPAVNCTTCHRGAVKPALNL